MDFSSLKNQFWTVLDEMLEDIRDCGLSVDEANDEYVIANDYEDTEFQFFIGHANRTMWIESIKVYR